MLDLPSFGYGVLVTVAVFWIWYHYAPPPGADRSRDARDLARKRLSEK